MKTEYPNRYPVMAIETTVPQDAEVQTYKKGKS